MCRAEHFPAGQVDKSAKIIVEIFVMRHGFSVIKKTMYQINF